MTDHDKDTFDVLMEILAIENSVHMIYWPLVDNFTSLNSPNILVYLLFRKYE